MNSLFSFPLIMLLSIFAGLSFFFALSETAVIGLSKIRLRHMLTKAVKRSVSIQRLITHSDKFIVGILVGNNFANISFSVIISAIFANIIGGKWAIILATLFSTFFILVFCEILPKILALKNTEKMALFTSPIMELFIKFINPLTTVFLRISDGILKLLRIEHVKRSALVTEEELRLLIEVGKEEGVLTDEERKMLQRIFEFGDIKIKDVMVPKEKIVAVKLNSSPEEVLNIFAEEGHARLPVYQGSIDNIVGIIYARDLLYILKEKGLFVLEDLVRKPYYASLDLKVIELLRRFQIEKIQIAIVVDEERNAVGMVTLEDLIEEIVGEIEEDQSLRER